MQETNIELSNRKNRRSLVEDQKGALSIQWMVLIVGLIGIALAVAAAVREQVATGATNVGTALDDATSAEPESETGG